MNEILPGWEIVKKIGSGSYGTVYEAVKKDSYTETRSAIKVISVPQNSSELDALYSAGMPEDSTSAYLDQVVSELVNEIGIMQTFKGTQNIVSIEDYDVVKKDILERDIYIRMELLTPLCEYMKDNVLSEKDVVKLGIDICNALVLFGKKNIIHRDIKPDNIFVNEYGNFKLGDFGIARSLENMTHGLTSRIGTPNYMAPEVYKGESYDARADIYSLGLVLYRLSNNNCLPFWNYNDQLHTPQKTMPLSPYTQGLSDAFMRRMNGDSLPAPCNASPEMSRIILRACSYDPNNRYSTANEMKRDLISFLNDDKTIPIKPLVHPRNPDKDHKQNHSILKKIFNKNTVMGIGIAMVLMIFSLFVALSYRYIKDQLSRQENEMNGGQQQEVPVTPEIETSSITPVTTEEDVSDQYTTSAMDATSIIGMWTDTDGHRWEFKSDGTMGTGGEYYGASYCLDNGCIIWDGTSIGKVSYYYLFDHEKNRISIIDRKTETIINTFYKIEETFEVYNVNNSPDSVNPFGSIDELSAGNDFIYIGGWAINPMNPSSPLKIAVYVGGDAATGEFAGEYTGNFDRDDIASNYGVNKEHGISIVIEASFSGLRDIYVYAIDEETGNNSLLGYGMARVAGF